MTEFYYTVTRNEIRPSMPAVPVLVSAAGWTVPQAGKKGVYRLRDPPLPAHVRQRGADCGGFVAATRWGGQYRFSARQYVTWLMKVRPQWAATMDLSCLTFNEHGTYVYPGKMEVARRQAFTTEMAYHFWEVYQHVPFTWVVTLQGWYLEEYIRHAQALAPLIREMAETYLDPAIYEEDGAERYYRVGIGSLCGRDPQFVQTTIQAVREIIGPMPLHLWGTKLAFLRSPEVDLAGIVSLDSASWNNLWFHKLEERRQSGLSRANYSWLVSYPRYASRLATALQRPRRISRNERSLAFRSLFAPVWPGMAPSPLPDHMRYRRSGMGSGEATWSAWDGMAANV